MKRLLRNVLTGAFAAVAGVCFVGGIAVLSGANGR